MMRWLREIFHPAEKCTRVGHRVRVREYRVYLYPPAARWAVAERAWMKQSSCSRCNHADREEEISRTALDGLTMDSDRWDALERDGRLEI